MIQNQAQSLLVDQEDDDDIMTKYFNPIEVIGRGAFSVVISAYDTLTQQKVAIKIINKKELKKSDLEMLKKESIILSKLNHQNIVRYKMSKETTGKLFIIMEHVEGQSLEDLINIRASNQEYFTESELIEILKQLLTALSYIHSMDIIHRDIKPENILVETDEFEEGFTLKIIDFGLSFFHDQTIIHASENCGTLLYMAPEVALKSPYDYKADIWSVGIILYQMITLGGHPFWNKGKDNRKSYQQKLADPQLSAELPDKIKRGPRNFFLRSTSINPSFRMTAKEALLHPWIQGKEIEQPMTELFEQFKNQQIFFNIIAWIMLINKFIRQAKSINDYNTYSILTSDFDASSQKIMQQFFSVKKLPLKYVSIEQIPSSEIREKASTNHKIDPLSIQYEKQITKSPGLKGKFILNKGCVNLMKINEKQSSGSLENKRKTINREIVEDNDQNNNKTMRRVYSHGEKGHQLNIHIPINQLNQQFHQQQKEFKTAPTSHADTKELKLPPLNPKVNSATKKSSSNSNLHFTPSPLLKNSSNYFNYQNQVNHLNYSTFYKNAHGN